MRYTAVIAAIVLVGLLNMGASKASAAALTNVQQSNFVNKVLLASADGTKDTTSSKTSSDTSANQSSTSQQPVAATPATPAPVIVTVQEGDNLSSIAAANNSTWQRIYDVNLNITDPNIINPGEQLRIPTSDEQLTDRALPQTTVVPIAITVVAASATPTAHASVQATYPVSANAAKAFIYAHESGNNPNATNPNGCYGLGQDCNGRVRTLCGADYACQDAYFTNYAMSRYGSWENALAFWQAHHWW